MRATDRPLEYSITQRAGAGGLTERYERPKPVIEMAQRLHRWRGAPETCQSCSSLPAVSVRAGMPLCSRCSQQRSQRLYNFRDLEGLRPRRDDGAVDDAGLPMLRGHAIVFNKKSVDMGFFEIIRPAAADRMEAEKPDLRALWNHDTSLVLGRTSAGTLRAKKVSRGVAIEIDPPRAARGYVETVERRDVTQMSFGFIPLDDDWHLEDGYPHREIFDMEIFEFSGVAFPAYPDTDLQIATPGSRSAWTREDETRIRLQLAKAR